MQAKLPDINARLVRYLNTALNAYDTKDYIKAAIAFDGSIALLPVEYKLEIDTQKYTDETSKKYTIECRECNEQHERNDVQAYELLLTNIDRLILLNKTMYVWDCPKCGHSQPLDGSRKRVKIFKEPQYTKIIPEPPKREGLHDRVGYSHRYWSWFAIVIKELESQIGLFRADYAAQQDSDIVDESFLDKDEKI